MADYQYICKEGAEDLTAKQLHKQHGLDLPMLVSVTRGFLSSREETTFSVGQVLRIHEVRHQERALVHDERRNTLSIPLDCEHQFFIENKSRTLTLREIAQMCMLPIVVTFADPHVHFDLDNTISYNLASLKVVRMHRETYFLANNMYRGRPLPEVIPIPLYMKEVRFQPIIGIRGRGITDDGQEELRRILHPEAVSGIDFHKDHSDKEMVHLSSKPLSASDNIHKKIETIQYIFSKRMRRSPPPPPPPLPATPTQSPPPSPPPSIRRNSTRSRIAAEVPADVEEPVYANIDSQSCESYDLPLRHDADGRSWDDGTEYEVIGPAPGREEPPSDIYVIGSGEDETTTTTGCPPIASELQRALQKRKERLEKGGVQRQTSPSTKEPGAGGGSGGNYPQWKLRLKPTKPDEASPEPEAPPSGNATFATFLSPFLSTTNTTGKSTGAVSTAGSSPATTTTTITTKTTSSAIGPPPPPRPLKPKLAPADKPHGLINPNLPPKPSSAGGGPRAPTKQGGKPDENKPTASSKALSPSSSSSGSASLPQPPLPAVAPCETQQQPATAQQQQNVYTNEIEMAVVGPTPRRSSPESSGSAERDASSAPNSPQTSPPAGKKPDEKEKEQLKKEKKEEEEEKKEIVKPLREMTIADVQALLSRLRLDKYQTEFKDQQMDGVLLGKLEEEDLKEDFKMSRLERMRLMAFVKEGHIPK